MYESQEGGELQDCKLYTVPYWLWDLELDVHQTFVLSPLFPEAVPVLGN
jgi:hypothetical protein